MPLSSARVVVSDAGPLISLGRLDMLGLLPKVFAQVQVPQQVWDECLAQRVRVGADAARLALALSNGWLQLCHAAPALAPDELGLGERSAIGRALEIGAGLLADDQAARRYAIDHGLLVIGTLGVLGLAKRSGHIVAVAPLIDRLRASGQRLSHAAVSDALALAGETQP